MIAENETSRIAIIAVVIEDMTKSNLVNSILHDYAELFIGRMGIPFKQRKVSVITLIAEGTNDKISALTGKLGRIAGVSVNSMLTKNKIKEDITK